MKMELMVEPIITERVAIIVWRIAHGHSYTTAEVATICGMTWDGAHKLLCRVSRILPIYLENGRWKSAAN